MMKKIYTLYDVEDIRKCVCGALTVTMKDGNQYHMYAKTFKEIFGVTRVPRAANAKNPYGCCDHCVNHYGIDLCACGSGKAPDKCHEGLSMCGSPYEDMNGGFDQNREMLMLPEMTV